MWYYYSTAQVPAPLSQLARITWTLSKQSEAEIRFDYSVCPVGLDGLLFLLCRWWSSIAQPHSKILPPWQMSHCDFQDTGETNGQFYSSNHGYMLVALLAVRGVIVRRSKKRKNIWLVFLPSGLVLVSTTSVNSRGWEVGFQATMPWKSGRPNLFSSIIVRDFYLSIGQKMPEPGTVRCISILDKT